MRKLSVLILGILTVLVVCSPVLAEVTWVTANQATVGWEAVSKIITNTGEIDIPAGDAVQYKVFLANAITDPEKANPAYIATTEALEYTYTLGIEGMYYAGVQGVRIPEGTEEEIPALISWSDDPVFCVDGTVFGIRMYWPTKGVGGFGPK